MDSPNTAKQRLRQSAHMALRQEQQEAAGAAAFDYNDPWYGFMHLTVRRDEGCVS